MCKCFEAEIPPATPVVTPADLDPIPVPELETVKTPQAKQRPGTKRKLSSKEADEPPAKKILGDGTRSPTTPVTWRSCSTGIVIKLVKYLNFIQMPSEASFGLEMKIPS